MLKKKENDALKKSPKKVGENKKPMKNNKNNKKNKKDHKVLKIIARCATGLIAGAAAGFLMFTLIPQKVVPVVQETKESYLDKLKNKVLAIIDEGKEDEIKGLTGEFDNVAISWSNEFITNYLEVNGSVELKMKSLKELSFNIETKIKYNNFETEFAVGYNDSSIFAVAEGFNYKINQQSASQALETTTDLISSIEENKFNLPEEIVNFDLLSLIGDIGSIETSEVVYDTYVEIYVTIDYTSILLTVDKQNINLLNVQFESEDLSDISIGGKIVFNHHDEYTIKSMDDPTYKIPRKFSESLFNTSLGFKVEGSVLDNADIGFKFDGNGQFNLDEKHGFGTIVIDECKKEKDKISASHKIDIDVDNSSELPEEQNMKFVYRNKLKGKFRVDTLNDMIGVIDRVINSDNPRFTKFIDPLKELIIGGIINEIAEGDFVSLLSKGFIKEITHLNNGMSVKVVLRENLIPNVGDLTLQVNSRLNKDGIKEIESIEFINLKFDLTYVNFKISFSEYDKTKVTPVDVTDTFMDLSSLGLLLQFGIDTTELNYYHLHADFDLALKFLFWDISLEDISTDFYIYVDGVSTKVYGQIHNLPESSIISRDKNTQCSVEFVFEPNDGINDDYIGGTFHIVREEIYKGTTTYYYNKSSSSNFVDNIINYIFVTTLNIKPEVVEKIVDMSKTDPVYDSNYEDLFSDRGFNYYTTDGNHYWEMGLDLKALTGNKALGDIDIDLTCVEDGERGYLDYLEFKTSLASLIDISGGIYLLSHDANIQSWSDDVNAAYTKIINIYKNFDKDTQLDFDKNYFNHPFDDYKLASF